MRVQYLVQALCLLKAVEAQSPKDEFDAICSSEPSQDGDLKTLDNGYKFQYVCKHTGNSANAIEPTLTAETIDECAEHCASRDDCKGSAWVHNFQSCQLFTSAEDLQSRRTGIFLRRDVPVPDPEPLSPKAQFEAVCDDHDGDFVTLDNGEKFKYVCRQAGVAANLIEPALEADTIEECAALCATNEKCKGSTWIHSFGSCQLYTNGDEYQPRRAAVFLRREVQSADCTHIESDLKDCEASETALKESETALNEKVDLLQEDIRSCLEYKEQLEDTRADLEEKLEKCNDCEKEKADLQQQLIQAQKCEAENGYITELNQQLEQFHKDAATSAQQLQQCNNNAATGAQQLQQCRSDAVTNTQQLQKCKTDSTTTSQQLQQCQDDSTKSAQQLQTCQTQLQKCKTDAATSAQLPQVKDCRYGGSDQIIKIGNRTFKQKCPVTLAKNRMPLSRVVRPGLTKPECLLICALDSTCVSVYYVGGTATTGECQLQSRNIESMLARSSAAYGDRDWAFVPA
ncbi:uncharacterized protein N7496_003550 [Penicillium cataractarum]|uniref:Apple domain-containing protein n=1 Tax=Penicillium cataractarum TaxID=2100454 RepID=A0A9W9SMP1_9EURO|nr:uncharacterized protein N7496_003550 [Penicillium cataractarum]KAJ5381122.1 hypothetical protein N7496_003550 [Penicillium cataractarum]